ncbi:putative ABC transport system permease protein [Solirubrobacter pauli]|uniref:Putative ABC transport system permease protein n=1 Tax=Solirubrobacter pauli TaxID=166793 RepID=A0A660L8U8_9ACTN|nr:FtsX-like permease family protein [Solirubrobacter pauli]RKQ91487.1 putative ABC transport system permease protein [Solirubrobacter pauli]
MIRVTWKGLAARPIRTALTTLAIVVGVAFVCAAYTLTDTMSGAADTLTHAAYDGTDAVVVTKTAFKGSQTSDIRAQAPTIPAATLDRVRATPGVTIAVGDITDTAQIMAKDGKPVGTGPYFGVGFDAKTPDAERLTPFRLHDGRWATGPSEVVIDRATAEGEGYAVGDVIRVAARGEARTFTLTGIADFAGVKSLGKASAAIFDLDAARTLFAKDGYDRILVAGTRDVDAGAGTEVRTAAEDDRFAFSSLETLVTILRTILLAFAAVAVVVGSFTIFNSLSITVAQRTREFGLLRMVGATRRQVRGAVLLEALTIGLLASIVGLGVGVGLAEGLNALFTAVGAELPTDSMVVASRTVVVSLAVGTLATVLAAMIPARRATRIAPVAALRDSTHTAAPGPLARGVRALASLVGRPSAAVGGAAGALARRNAMRNPGRTAVTALALTIGVALVTAVTVVATGLEHESRGALDRRVQATSIVTAADGWSPIDPKVETAIGGATSSIRQDGALVFGAQEGVNGVDPATIGRFYRFDFTDGGLTRDGAVVDEGFADEHGLEVGSPLSIMSMSGTTLELTVSGIERSPVLDVLGLGPITIPHAAFDRTFEQERNRLTFADHDATAALAAFPNAKAQDKAAFIDGQTEWIGMILAILWVLLALAVIVSLFGIVNTLVLSTFERMRELGTLRALGFSRRQVRRMVRHESVITALIGATLGIAVGLLLAVVVVQLLSEYGLAFSVPAGSLLAVALIAALAGMLAATMPARRASKIDVLKALAYE